MNNIFLPTLKSIEINNYTLYPNGLNFKHDFVNGVNLIMGGNGMGKTTFVNIVKYAIIGHYKKQFDFTQTYRDRSIEKRISHPIDYFINRADKSIVVSSKPAVIIVFDINDIEFTVERCLENIEIKSVKISQAGSSSFLEGNIVPQYKYDKLSYEEKVGTLQFAYEEKVAELSCIAFDGLILFVNQVLFFGEDHKTVLWDEGQGNIQEELFNKYFNDPDEDAKRQDAIRQSKYNDTQSRHRSEDIRVIKKVLENIKNKSDNPEDSILEHINDLKSQVSTKNNELDQIQLKRIQVDELASIKNNEFNQLTIQIDELDTKHRMLEQKSLNAKWMTRNDKYEIYKKNIQNNHSCPMCNQELELEFVNNKINSADSCFLCDQTIREESEPALEKEVKEIDSERERLMHLREVVQREKYNCESEQKLHDKEFNKYFEERRRLSAELRKLEFQANQEETDGKVDQLQAFYEEIDSLEKKKLEFQEKSVHFQKIADGISLKIANEIKKNVGVFSSLFAGFAGEFLGVDCSLTYDSYENKPARFYPVINGQIRKYEEELSESQRFFIDHSFRMSILSFFYSKPSFYIVETPDSSLDISYERNAADVFIKFLNQPYALIITTNLNNSEFLNYLTQSNIDVGLVDLIELGKRSVIQGKSSLLKDVYDSVISKIRKK